MMVGADARIIGITGWSGYKRDHHPKIEIYRPAVGKPLRQPADASIVAIASAERVPEATTAVIDINNVKAVAT